jgi:hypothetical protein
MKFTMVCMKYHPGTVKEGDVVTMVRDPNNSYDANAIKIVNAAGEKCGHLTRPHAIEAGKMLEARDIDANATVGTKYSTSIAIIAKICEVEREIRATKEHVEAHPFPAYDAMYGLIPKCFDIAKVLYGRMTDEHEARSLGHLLFAEGGRHAMVATIYLLKHALKDADHPVRGMPRLVEMCWDGIGGWQA